MKTALLILFVLTLTITNGLAADRAALFNITATRDTPCDQCGYYTVEGVVTTPVIGPDVYSYRCIGVGSLCCCLSSGIRTSNSLTLSAADRVYELVVQQFRQGVHSGGIVTNIDGRAVTATWLGNVSQGSEFCNTQIRVE